MNDMALVAQVAVFGNRRAFDTLLRKHQSEVRRFLLGLTLGDAQLADDLAQETFIKAYTGIGKFRGLSSFSTWLMRIAYNTHYDYRRRHHITDGIDTAAAARPDTRCHDCAISIDILKALATLKPDERTCIMLQLVDGQTIESITAITGITQSTVKSHLHRGKEKLKRFLKDNGYGK